jgi:RNA polymerase sigma-70 factor (family 1)
VENDDEKLLILVKDGDLQAYGQLFKKYYKLLNAEAYYLLGDVMEAEDLVQNLFVEIWDKKICLNIHNSVKAYLRVSVRNKSLTLLEKRKVNQKRYNDYIQTLEEKTEDIDPDKIDVDSNINRIIDKLPQRRLQVVNLVFGQNKKYKEAAAEMGISINSVKTHLKLAIKVLKAQSVNFKKNNSPDLPGNLS